MNTNCRASIHSHQTMSYSAPPSRVNYISEIPYITHPIYDISDPLIKLLNLACIPSMWRPRSLSESSHWGEWRLSRETDTWAEAHLRLVRLNWKVSWFEESLCDIKPTNMPAIVINKSAQPTSKPKLYCRLCHKSSMPKEVYTGHNFADENCT